MVTKIKNSIAVLLVAAFAGFAGAGAYFKIFENQQDTKTTLNEAKKPVSLVNFTRTPGETATTEFVTASESTVPAVVHVTTTYGATTSGNGQYNPFQDFFWGDRGFRSPAPSMSSGSGVIITDDGYIVTNNHVVANSDKVEVTLNDKRTLTAKVIGTDPSTDIALLKIDDKGLPFIPYGNSDDVKVGEWVLAVGNPFNLTSTVTAGIVSAKARNIHILPDQQFPIESFIQTDAAVNQGNSGGGLFTADGQLIGINSAILAPNGTYAGYSFAIPVNIVKKIVNDLIEFGDVKRGYLGISYQPNETENARLLKQAGLKEGQGVYVQSVPSDGAASQAGLKEGDIITKINGAPVSSGMEMSAGIASYRPGEKVPVTYIRNGKENTVNVVLKGTVSKIEVSNAKIIGDRLGVELENLDNKKAAEYDVGVDHSRLQAIGPIPQCF